MKRIIAAGIFALTLAAGAAEARGGPYALFGPPPPPYEVMMMRPGPYHVWVPGYYRWTGNHYRWVRGRWMKPPRHRAVWMPGYWAPQRGGWVFVGGYWR